MSARKLNEKYQLSVSTAQGEFVAHYSELGLCGLDFPSDQAVAPGAGPVPAETRRWHGLTTRCVKDVLAGRQPGEFPPLDLSAGTEFQQTVWRALMNIGLGQTRTYGELAALVHRKLAVRAVGSACGANPIPLLVPCHRVLAANGKLGGFTAGLDWKRILLKREGVL